MSERERGPRKVDLQSIYADRPDILERLFYAQELYEPFIAGEMSLEEVSKLIEQQILKPEDEEDELTRPDQRLRGVNALSALRDNMSLGILLPDPQATQAEDNDINQAA